MKHKAMIIVAGLALALLISNAAMAFNSGPPESPVKLIFIHHSTGENWLSDESGHLGRYLRDQNYFVSDTNYGWGPDGIGDRTDIGNWWEWFAGPSRDTFMSALLAESGQNSTFPRLDNDPGGENQIIMFKSCFPNSDMKGGPNDPATEGDNPLRAQDAYSDHHTVANAKGIYNEILAYFATRQDKMFVVITAPPLGAYNTTAEHATNIRAFNNWLVFEWLKDYPHKNVMVFDFYNVLTSNGGDQWTDDYYSDEGNHHRVWNNQVRHTQTVANNYSAYSTDEWDDHPTGPGGEKASNEFTSLLNAYYHCWRGTHACPQLMDQP